MTVRANDPALGEVTEYVTARYLQQRYHLSRAAFYRNLKIGRLPQPVRIGPRVVRWPRSEVEAFERRLLQDRGRTTAGAGQQGGAA